MNDELFTGPEIERANYLPARTMELLKRHGIGPKAAIPAVRGKADVHDFSGFCFYAATAALHHAGMGVVAAARIATPLTEELVSIYGEIPWGADRWRELPGDGLGDLLNAEGKVVALRMLVKMIASGTVNIGKAFEGDYKLIIADGVRAYSTGDQRLMVFSPHSLASTTIVPEFFILPSKRGEDTNFVKVEPKDHQEFLDALEFAIGIVQVNISLAIRLALYKVYDMRRLTVEGEQRGSMSE